MKTRTRINWILTLFIALSMLLSACGGAATTVAPPPQPEATEAVAPTEAPAEPTAPPEPTQVQPATEAQLDGAYDPFLASMVAYNTLGLDAFAEMMAEDPTPFVLDVRSPSEAEEKGYIEGAVLVPLRELGQNLDKLPAFDEPIVSYCGSGWRCTIAMTGLGALGWEDVKSLKGGSYGGWVEAGYPTVEGVPPEAEALNAAEPDPSLALTMDAMFSSIPEDWGVITADDLSAALVENPDLVVIDVRRAEEVEEKGYIDGSIHIPLEDFVAGKADWPADKDAPVVIYCGSGHRSTMAMTILWSYGYTDVHSLKGGFAAWVDGGYEVTGGTAPDVTALLDEAYTTFLADMEAYNTIGLDALNLALGEEPPPYLLDVRSSAEAEETGHIESAYLIPLRELGENYDMLPSFETPIVSYCGSGWRCTIAMTALGALGWEDVKALKGGSYGGWVEAGYPTVAGVPPEAEPLNAAAPDPVLAALFNEVLSNIPEGWGVITVDDLFLELGENPDLILIDVRRPEERTEKGVIDAPNQVAIPLEDFIANQADWPADKDATIVTYCGSGHRSTMAMTILWSYGFTDVHSMKGGFGAWTEAGYPVAEAETMQ